MRRRISLPSLALALLAAGCAESGPWPRRAEHKPPERVCAVFAPCEEPPGDRPTHALILPFPTDGPYRSPPTEAKVSDFRSQDCDDRCAEKRARRVETRRRAIRDYNERLYRDWIPADDPRRWH